MNNALDLKKTYGRHLVDAKLVDPREWDNFRSPLNKNIGSSHLLQAALLSGFYPNVVCLREGELTKDKIKNTVSKIDMKSGNKIRFASECLLNMTKPKDAGFGLNRRYGPSSGGTPDKALGDGYAVYFNSFFSEDARQLTVRDASLLSPLNLLIFAGKKVEHIPSEDEVRGCGGGNRITIQLDDYQYLRFSMLKEDVDLVIKWKQVLYCFSYWFILKDHPMASVFGKNAEILQSMKDFIQITSDLLQQTSPRNV
jgi:hypothetical protein